MNSQPDQRSGRCRRTQGPQGPHFMLVDAQCNDTFEPVFHPLVSWALSILVGATAVFMWIGFGVSLS
ncbi:MAG TPA: hypothetical protein DCQ06_04020 [Myxococcales bacterium]|nr:hypothetical protein [Myxococcales bacterium]HAN30741.1 hypothetical protein [Myxococcales bacterium]